MIFKKGLDRSHVSDLDKFLFQFDETTAQSSASQTAEMSKANKISTMRDDPHYEPALKILWEDF